MSHPIAQGLCSFDLTIVGTGPAGATAAKIAASAGLSTLLVEKAALPRHKTCGGGILGRALGFLGESMLPASVIERSCHTAEMVLTDRLRFSVTRTSPVVVMTMRDKLDEWLTQKAVAAGAILRTHCTVQDIATTPAGIRLTTSQGEIKTCYLIAADGANSLIGRKLRFPDYPCIAPALECEVSVDAATFDKFSKAARFDFHDISHGYAWVFPKKTHLSIGVLTLDPKRANLNDLFARYLARLNITPLSIERHGYIIPLAPRDKILARNAVLLTGDAAGLADPVTAEGISNAIKSAQLAARAVITHFANPAEVERTYNQTVNDEILEDLRHARRAARLLYTLPRTRNALFHFRGQRLTETMTDIVTGRSSYRSLLTSPANYLRFFAPKRPTAAPA